MELWVGVGVSVHVARCMQEAPQKKEETKKGWVSSSSYQTVAH
jgi:hypothetical protein